MKRIKSFLFASLVIATTSTSAMAGEITGRSGEITGRMGEITGLIINIFKMVL